MPPHKLKWKCTVAGTLGNFSEGRISARVGVVIIVIDDGKMPLQPKLQFKITQRVPHFRRTIFLLLRNS